MHVTCCILFYHTVMGMTRRFWRKERLRISEAAVFLPGNRRCPEEKGRGSVL